MLASRLPAALVALAALVVTGCLTRGEPRDGGTDAGTDCGFAATPATRYFVISTLAAAAGDPTGDPSVVAGLDVDGYRTVSRSDPMGCGFVDFRSGPPDDIAGVDNQLGPILVGVAGSWDINVALQEDIDAGRLLLLVEVSEVDSDTCSPVVTVSVLLGRLPPGVTMPALGGDGRLAVGQMFDVQSSSLGADGTAVARASGRIAGGRVIAGPFELTFPMRFPTMVAVAHVHRAELRFDRSASGRIERGVLGGRMQLTEAVNLGVALLGADYEPTIYTVLAGQADLEPDRTGVCQALSIGFVLAGVPALRGTTVGP